MRIAAIALILAAGSAYAQRNAVSPSGFGRVMFPGGGPTTYGATAAPSPYGNVLFPGTGAPYAVRNNYPTQLPVIPAVQHNRGHGSRAVVPYPVFVGGSYYPYDAPLAYGAYGTMPQAWPTPGQPGFSGSSYGQPLYQPIQQPVAESQQEQSPVVVINQYFRPDGPQVTQTSSAGTPASAAPQAEVAQAAPNSADMQNIFLIAMKDHTIYAANSYWVEGNTLSYVTVQGTENSVSMDLVDRDLSRRLNRERKVAFGLPTN